LQRYIFNANYLDYPVTGLSLFQVDKLYQWMTDRYAENKLVAVGYYNFNPEQRDEDSFSLESHLVGQYQGDVRIGPRRNLEDDFFIPAFRPPVKREKSYARKVNRKGETRKAWRPYEMRKNDFLRLWNDEYIEKVENDITLKINFDSVPLRNDYPKIAYKRYYHSFHIKDRKTFYGNSKYIEEAKGIVKDEFGKMPFNYIGKNAYGRPIIRDNYPLTLEVVSDPSYSFYWLAFDTEIQNIYWP